MVDIPTNRVTVFIVQGINDARNTVAFESIHVARIDVDILVGFSDITPCI